MSGNLASLSAGAKIADGVIVVDKPAAWTSHDVVGKMRRVAGEKRIGHLGTLDPLATGVLPLIVGRATRLARFFTANHKRYDALLRFGVTSNTYDGDGVVVPSATPAFNRHELETALDAFRGTFAQTPPPVSAKKIAGTPAYKLVRQNIPVELAPVQVTVHSLELLDFDGTAARLIVDCAGGTYVRSLAHDLGQRLGCGAILEQLRRLSSGGFTLEQSHTLPALELLASENRLGEALIPAAQLLPEIPNERVDSTIAAQIRQGRDFRVSPFRVSLGSQFVKAIDEEGRLLAIGEAVLPHLYHPVLVL